MVAYERWSFERNSNCRALTGKNLVFWISGRVWKVIAYERWSHIEVRLYHVYSLLLSVSCGPQNCFHDVINKKHNSMLADFV